jgi:hypothetical protein
MGQKRNLTIQLDVDIIRQARILAVHRDMSISRLVAELLERYVHDEERYRAAWQCALADLETGFHLGGQTLPTRDELHER